MAVYSPINKKELLNFLKQYNIGKLIKFEGILEGIENTNYKITTTENIFILTIFEKRINRDELPFFINLKNHLANKKFPCPVPIISKEGKSINKLKNKSCVIISYLEGTQAKKVTINHCKQVGKILSLLHIQSQDFNQKRLNNMNYSQWNSIFLKCKKIFDHNYIGLIPFIDKELSYLKNNWPHNLPEGVVHADVFQDNVFFKNDILSGLIDFYFACNDFLAYDLALTINAWCFDEQLFFNKKKFQYFINEYQNKRILTTEEKDSMSILLRGAAIRILITRLHDQLYHPKGAFVKPKDPNEYVKILKFHQENDIINFL